jgi:hypothetical protein
LLSAECSLNALATGVCRISKLVADDPGWLRLIVVAFR